MDTPEAGIEQADNPGGLDGVYESVKRALTLLLDNAEKSNFSEPVPQDVVSELEYALVILASYKAPT